MPVKICGKAGWARVESRYACCLTWGMTMKPLLHLKTALLIAYVALCTHLVLELMQTEPALHFAPAAHVFGD